MENITDWDYNHAKRICNDFKLKNLGEYYDLHLESDTLLLANIFKNVREMCFINYQLKFINETKQKFFQFSY